MRRGCSTPTEKTPKEMPTHTNLLVRHYKCTHSMGIGDISSHIPWLATNTMLLKLFWPIHGCLDVVQLSPRAALGEHI